ncbi:uncharacterized protein LOC131662957 [Phymastichus coffea]|uniref:uncharacterized protein LOC131662957 n=1 Tax=Phymastichus coffea TaxID=108790 RepID=UPI00273BC49E|nr:uncharacterized protein LOC131662957 [Phymastichus coffea]
MSNLRKAQDNTNSILEKMLAKLGEKSSTSGENELANDPSQHIDDVEEANPSTVHTEEFSRKPKPKVIKEVKLSGDKRVKFAEKFPALQISRTDTLDLDNTSDLEEDWDSASSFRKKQTEETLADGEAEASGGGDDKTGAPSLLLKRGFGPSAASTPHQMGPTKVQPMTTRAL